LKIIDVGIFLFYFIKISLPVHFLFKWSQNLSARPRIMKMHRGFFFCEEGTKPLCIKHVRFSFVFKSHRFPLTSYLPKTSFILPVTQNNSADARHSCGLLVSFNEATLSTQSLAAPTNTKHGIFSHIHRLFLAFKNVPFKVTFVSGRHFMLLAHGALRIHASANSAYHRYLGTNWGNPSSV